MMQFSRRRNHMAPLAALLVMALVCTYGAPCWAIVAGYTDTFNDGSLNGWRLGNPDPYPQIVSDNGKAGTGDHSLYMATLGAPEGSTFTKLIVMNDSLNDDGNWEGDWTAAGLTTIQMDVLNTNAFTLNMRLGIAGPSGVFQAGGGDTYLTTAIDVPSNPTTWQTISFPVLATDFQPFGGTLEDRAAALTDVTHFRVLHNPAEDFIGASFFEPPGGTFYLDNIQAIGTPQSLAGDYNANLAVDAADYVVWRDQRNQAVTPGTGADGTGPGGTPDGLVDDLDYDFWKARFGNVPAGLGSSLAAAVVPEPVGWVCMTGLFLVAWVLVRKRA